MRDAHQESAGRSVDENSNVTSDWFLGDDIRESNRLQQWFSAGTSHHGNTSVSLSVAICNFDAWIVILCSCILYASSSLVCFAAFCTITRFADHAFRCSVPAIWNSVYTYTLCCSSLALFKHSLKAFSSARHLGLSLIHI